MDIVNGRPNIFAPFNHLASWDARISTRDCCVRDLCQLKRTSVAHAQFSEKLFSWLLSTTNCCIPHLGTSFLPLAQKILKLLSPLASYQNNMKLAVQSIMSWLVKILRNRLNILRSGIQEARPMEMICLSVDSAMIRPQFLWLAVFGKSQTAQQLSTAW